MLNERVSGNSRDLPKGRKGVCGRFVSYFAEGSIIISLLLPMHLIGISQEIIMGTLWLLGCVSAFLSKQFPHHRLITV